MKTADELSVNAATQFAKKCLERCIENAVETLQKMNSDTFDVFEKVLLENVERARSANSAFILLSRVTNPAAAWNLVATLHKLAIRDPEGDEKS